LQIIIPMTGYGSRFVEAGYKNLKPFIEIEGRSILEWIVKGMFPNEKNFIFVCRQEHLNTIENMREKLLTICPTAKIHSIGNWVKKGPVYDVLTAEKLIDNEIPAIINYCDFYMNWNWAEFKKNVIARNCEGSVPCYTGFHPHLIPEKNLYATCKTDENEDLIEIKEKFSFFNDKTKNLFSPGIYYFKTGNLLKKYCQKLVDSDQHINGEYYASLPYNFMVNDGLKVWIPSNVKYFCQWGTPFDMQESVFWIKTIKEVIKNEHINSNGR